LPWAVVINSKIFILTILSLLIISSCQEELQKGSELSASELAYIRARAAAKCVAESNTDFSDYEDSSNSVMMNSERGNTWKLEYKKDNTVIDTSYIYVWKVSSPFVYYRIKLTESGVVKNQFLKVDTTTNDEMMRNLQEQDCAKTLDVAVGPSSMTVNVDTGLATEDSSTLVKYERDYRLITSYPAYFGSLNRKITKKSYNNDEELQKTEVFDYVFTNTSDTTLPDTYNDASIINAEYCVVTNTTAVLPDTLDNYTFPFSLTCSTSDTNGPDGNGDTVEDFDPATELVI
jgi:hypothetical protein